MSIKSIFYLFFLWAFFPSLKEAYSLVVKDVKIFNQEGLPTFFFAFNDFFSPEIDQEDDETLLIEFPEDTEWKAPLSSRSNLGLSYTYIPYQDGAGDLLIKKNKRLVVGNLKQNQHNECTLSFYAIPPTQKPTIPSPLPPPPPQNNQNIPYPVSVNPPILSNQPFTIRGIRAGYKNRNTRLVFDINRHTKFIIKENDDFSSIYILPTEITQWVPAPSSNESFGFFKGYKLIRMNNDVGIELSVQKGTRIVQALILDEKTQNPKLVLDLGPSSSVPIVDTLTNSNQINETHTAIKEKNNTLLNQGDSFSVFPEKGRIKGLNILTQNSDTIIRLTTSEVKNFDVHANNVTDEVTISLPKMIWENVKVTEEKAGLIKGFSVDQTDPEHTNLVFKVDKGTFVMGKKSFGIKDNGKCVVYLNQKGLKTPSWLISASSSELSYTDLKKADGEISEVIYRGGITPYTSIGSGFYVGLKAASLGGQQESTGTHGVYKTNLSTANFGGGIHLLGGYGINMNKIYTGAELNLGLYGADAKTSFTEGGGLTSSNQKIEGTWGVTGRLGYYVSPTSLFYGRLGVNSTKFVYKASPSASGQVMFPGSYGRNHRTGFLYGLGLESAVNDTLSVRVEGAQVTYQPFYYKSGTDYKKDRPILNEINLGVGYKLQPMSGPAMGDIYEESVGTGFYFGADAGLSTLLNRREVTGQNNTSTPTSYTGDGSTVDPSWGIFAGYSYHQDKFFLAGELQLTLTQPLISESVMNAGTTTESYSNKLRWLWALTARPGYIFNHGTIGYGRIGLVGGSLSHLGQLSGSAREFTTGGPAKSQALGIRLGAGLETFITRHLTLRSDYILDYMPGLKIKDFTNPNFNEKINLVNNEFKLGLSWYIDP